MIENIYQLTPTSELQDGEHVVQSFQADRATYIRHHTWMAAAAMAGGMAVLWAIGNPYIWTGAVGGLAAILVRGFYIGSDELGVRWDLTNRRLLGPQTRAINLRDIKEVRDFAGYVQIVTKSGDKHLLKYLPDRAATKAAIESAAARA